MRTLDAIPADLDRALRDAVAQAVGRYGGAVESIRRDLDHDGDECIYIEINYTRPDVPVDPEAISRLGMLVNEAALAHDESDFVYVRNHFPAGQQLDKVAVARILRGGTG